MLQRCISCESRVTPTFSWKKAVFFTFFHPSSLLPIEEWVCASCLKAIHFYDPNSCSLCSKAIEAEEEQFIREIDGRMLCYDCERWLLWEESNQMGRLLSGNLSSIYYNDWAQELIGRYKFKRDERLKYFFASLLMETWNDHRERLQLSSDKIDLVTSVPVSDQRLMERGFNQADRVASLVANHLNLPYYSDLVLRIDEDQKQSKKDRKGRMEDLLKKFIKNPSASVDIHNKSILVIDDIYTTGATLYAVSNILKCSGAKEVISLTIAR